MRRLFLLIVVFVFACEEGPTEPDADVQTDAEHADANTVDSEIADVASFDAHLMDAELADAELADAESADAEIGDAEGGDADMMDADVTDAGADAADEDAEALDAETLDAELGDAEEMDATALDAGAPDATAPPLCEAFPDDSTIALNGGYRAKTVATAAQGLDAPSSVAWAGGAFGGQLYVIDQLDYNLLSIDPSTGNSSVVVDRLQWPLLARRLTDVVWDEDNVIDGNLYVSDQGLPGDVDSVIYRVTPQGTVNIFVRGSTLAIADVHSLEFVSSSSYAPGLYVVGDPQFAGASSARIDANATVTPLQSTIPLRGAAFDEHGDYGSLLYTSLAGPQHVVALLPDGTLDVPLTEERSGALSFSPGGVFGDALYVSFGGSVEQISTTGTVTPIAIAATSIGVGGRIAFSSSGNEIFSPVTSGSRLVCVERYFDPNRCVPPSAPVRASVDSAGAEGNATSEQRAHLGMSADGRYLVFESDATNLVGQDTNAETDIFLRDLQTGVTERVNLGVANAQSVQASYYPSISRDGRYVAFFSQDGLLVPGANRLDPHIYVRDRVMATTVRASVNTMGNATSGGFFNESLSISGDGTVVAFATSRSNLVPSDTNGATDVFIRDLANGLTERVSVDSSGTQANNQSIRPSVSGDGRYVAFVSDAGNLVTNDTNAQADIFVRDRQLGVTTRVSVDSAGAEGIGSSRHVSISADGRFVTFSSDAALTPLDTYTSCPEDVYVHDRLMGTTELVSVDSGGSPRDHCSSEPTISDDGRFVAFYSQAVFVPDDRNLEADVYVRDRLLGRTTRVNVDASGLGGLGRVLAPRMSGDGTRVAFNSRAPSLVAGDANRVSDVFEVAVFSCP